MSEGKSVFYYENSDAFEQLAEGDNPIFESRLRLLVFAASVGYAHDRSVDSPDKDNAMRWSYINGDRSLSVITAALAYGVTNDPNALLDPDQQMEVLQQYGAGGARLITRDVIDEPGDTLDNLISFLQNQREEDTTSSRAGVLEQIEQEFTSLQQD
jgi:dnd system-associated protein 4